MPTTPAAEMGRVRLSLKDFLSWQPPSGRDWAELPLDVLSVVFEKLHTVELLMGGAAGVCRSWRRAARHEPELWHHVDMRGCAGDSCVRSHVPTRDLVQAAVGRSAGQCQAFWTDDADDDLLAYLAKEAPVLMSLRLISCGRVSNEGLIASIKSFPLLEELELSLCADVQDNAVFESVAKSCPRLKHLRLIRKKRHYTWSTVDQREAGAIATMKELRSLELYGNRLTRKELTAILDNCTRLNLLIVRGCPNLTMDDSLLARYAGLRIVTLLKGDSNKPRSRSYDMWWIECPTCDLKYPIRRLEYEFNNLLVDGFFPEDLQDYEDYSRYLNGVYVTDFDGDEDYRMLSKRLRRYLKVNNGVYC